MERETGWMHSFILIVFSILIFAWNFLQNFVWNKGIRSSSVILQGTRQPRFFQGTYQQAVSEASKSDKFLLVYLHSTLHASTPKFCQTVLCTDQVACFIEDHFVIWMADVLQPEGCKLAHNFGVTTYPFFAVVTNISNYSALGVYLQSLGYNKRITRNGLMLVSCKHGEMTAQQLIEDLTKTLENHGALLQAAKSERLDREKDRELIENQDRDYQESLKRDKAKERQRKEEEQRRILEEENRKKRRNSQRRKT
jgi:FAS-associated factor 2